jgi:hypothetical protein
MLRLGVPVACVMVIASWVWSLIEHSSPSFENLLFTFVAFVLGFGYLPAELQWRRCEKDYHDQATQ